MPGFSELLPGDPQGIAEYRLLGRLGSGGQGVVYLGEDRQGRRVAVKRLLTAQQDERARSRLAKEVSAAQRVAPFCTARILDADVTGPQPFIVSEFIEGPSLQDQVREHGPLRGSSLHWLAIGTATALAAIHQAGVVHRDLKPANVMLAADGPRVIDFGIARDLSTDVTVTSRVMGTPAYMAPEQLGEEEVGPAADVFAWASVVAFAATGKAPFEATHVMGTVQRIASGQAELSAVPDDLLPLIRRCLNRDPAQRPTAQQLLESLLGRPDPSPAEAAGMVQQAAGLPAEDRTMVFDREEPEQDRRGNRLLVRLAIGIVVVMLGVFFLGWAWQQVGDIANSAKDRLPTVATTPEPAKTTAKTKPPVELTTQPAAPNSVPDALDGTWEGTGFQPASKSHRLTPRVTLVTGNKKGKLRFVGLDCSGRVTVTESSDRQATMRAVIDHDPNGDCASSGELRMTALALGRATFFWRDNGDFTKVATGVLVRQ